MPHLNQNVHWEDNDCTCYSSGTGFLNLYSSFFPFCIQWNSIFKVCFPNNNNTHWPLTKMPFFALNWVISPGGNLNLIYIKLPSSGFFLFSFCCCILSGPAPMTWWCVWDRSRCLNLSRTFSTWRTLLEWIYIIEHDYPGLQEQYTEQYGLCGVCWQSCTQISVHIFNSILGLLLIDYLVLISHLLESPS